MSKEEVKLYKYTGGGGMWKPGPFRGTKTEILLAIEDHYINYLMRLYHYSLSKTELLEQAGAESKEYAKYLVEVEE